MGGERRGEGELGGRRGWGEGSGVGWGAEGGAGQTVLCHTGHEQQQVQVGRHSTYTVGGRVGGEGGGGGRKEALGKLFFVTQVMNSDKYRAEDTVCTLLEGGGVGGKTGGVRRRCRANCSLSHRS